MILAFLGAAAAQSPDAAIHAAVDERYRRDVPEAAVCIVRSSDAVAAVGVKRGARGCVLLGVMVGEELAAPEAAFAKAIGGESYTALDAAGRQKALLQFVDEVLLAFDQPSATVAGRISAGKGGTTIVERRLMRRDEASASSVDLTWRVTVDSNLMVVDESTNVHRRYQTTLFVRPDRLEGVSEAAVDAALTAHGRVISDCFDDSWRANLALDGRVRLEWTVADGKVGTVTVVTEPETDEALARCYARGVRSGTYPAGVTGTVRWIFAANRAEQN